jgi:hypothetical protein
MASDVFTLRLLEDGELIQSYSGVDYRVMAYIPALRGINPESLRVDQADEDYNIITTKEGDAFIDNMASLQTMSISSTRDHKAARRLGESDPFDYSRGSRTVAGSLVFAQIYGDAFRKFAESVSMYNAQSAKDSRNYSADALPPFNVILNAQNESGGAMFGVVRGIRITNTGSSFGIHDLYTEQVYSFVAEAYRPLDSLKERLSKTLSVTDANQTFGSLLYSEASQHILNELRATFNGNNRRAHKLPVAPLMDPPRR